MGTLLTFQEAIEKTHGQKPNVLLGNGFSQACRPDIFAYGALFDRANFGALSDHARGAFDVLGTTDFEIVMEALKSASKLVALYDEDDEFLAAKLAYDAESLRDVLVTAIASSHPASPLDIEESAYLACRYFLSRFDTIYSLNYDLLLYWTLMHEDNKQNEPFRLKCDDGFRTPADGETDYVTWEIENSNTQNIYYLHGALHLFDAGLELQKYTWCNTGVRIIDQVRNALENGYYPLFVAEGSSEQKLTRIKHHGYLSRGLRSIGNVRKPLFIYGLSMGSSDDHILKLIKNGGVSQLFVSIYGEPDLKPNQEIMQRANALAAGRGIRNRLEVHFFDAASAKAWG
ncbi:MAG: DUF4917 family protein [Pseudomonadales bacterium]|nr:DUF4917 family protein [Pseudomonadales bacterium]MCP5193849.1 DUF4917 family protein [Pseudomonadales bacterium]